MSAIEDLKRYKELLDEEIITQEEFNQQKEKILHQCETKKEPVEPNNNMDTIKQYDKHIYAWVFCFLLGGYGVDRFLRGQIPLGVIKLLTAGGLGVWALVDFIIAATKVYGMMYSTVDKVSFDKNGNYISI